MAAPVFIPIKPNFKDAQFRMIKWFVYIVFLLVFTPCLLLANTPPGRDKYAAAPRYHIELTNAVLSSVADTTKGGKAIAKTDVKVKEVPKTKSQPKPEKVDDADAKKDKEKPKRERRPDGMQRPPEIPRRNDN